MEYDDDTFDEAAFYAPAEAQVTDTTPADDEFDGQGEVTDIDSGDDADVTPDDTPQPNYFDPSTVADHLVKVKVDGEELEVPVAELLQGYSRTADYTRKTQSLAEERQQVAFWKQVDEAMRANPQATLNYLQQTYGITPEQATSGVDADDDWGYDDPVQRELRELRELVKPALQFTQEQQAERMLTQVVSGLSSKYGDEFNANEVITEAIARGIHDPRELEGVFKDMYFDKYRAIVAAQQLQQQTTATTDAQRRAAAQAAAAATGGGASVRGTNRPTPPSAPRNPREAVLAAFAEHGF